LVFVVVSAGVFALDGLFFFLFEKTKTPVISKTITTITPTLSPNRLFFTI
jgi:hypothetical protein